MKSVMQSHSFAQVPKVQMPRSSFNRSHGYKTTFDAGGLIPIYHDEALPGDTHMLNLTAFARLATPIKPVMDNIFMDFFFFSVPIRLLWDNFQKFMGEQDNPGDSTDFTIPQIDITTAAVGDITDYMGIPIGQTNTIQVSALNFRAYNLIYNSWFRDENLIDSVDVFKDDGPDASIDYSILNRGKRHDYFTSALPFPQKGASVSIPLGTTADILRTDNAPNPFLPMEAGTNTQIAAINPNQGGRARISQVGETFAIGDPLVTTYANDGAPTVSQVNMNYDPNGGLYADLSTATAATINSLRQAFQIQALLERDARGGTRYTEIIRAHFGVTSPDARLQRPEYLGGGTININITPVANTSDGYASSNAPVGQLSGFGVASGQAAGFSASFTEHCVVLGLVSVRADLNYQQGIERSYHRKTRLDFYWDSLAQIGEQAIENQEIFFDDITPANNTDVFGYQERYAEYRYKPSQITGLFRSNAPLTLDVWHLAQDFPAPPALNEVFIEEDPPIDRIIAVPSEPQFIYDSYIKLTSVRPMPVYGVPYSMSRL